MDYALDEGNSLIGRDKVSFVTIAYPFLWKTATKTFWKLINIHIIISFKLAVYPGLRCSRHKVKAGEQWFDE